MHLALRPVKPLCYMGENKAEPTHPRLCLVAAGWHISLASSTTVEANNKTTTHQDLLDFLVITLHVIFYDVLEDILPVLEFVHGLVGVRV